MAQNIFRKAIADEGLAERVLVTSCGLGGWHVGQHADDRARAELLRHGYSDEHIAAQLGPRDIDSDLLVAMDSGHLRELTHLGLGDRSVLLRSFDPDAGDDLDVEDPYYGGNDDFREVREEIEAAVPGLLAWTHEHLDDAPARSHDM